MLGTIREKFTGWIALAILTAIGLSFVFVGLNYNFAARTFAAKVDGESISIAALENAWRGQMQQTPQIAQADPAVRVQFRRNILDSLIQQQVIDNYLNDAGYRISTAELTDYVHSIPDFQLDGKFDKATYEETLMLTGNSVAEFEQRAMQSLRGMQLQRSIRGSSIVTPSDYRRFLNLAYEQRIVTTATISADTVLDDVNVSDEMIVAFYDDNPMLYQLPESADVEYIEILRSDVAGDVQVSEQQLRDQYEISKQRYLQDEQRQARHILILFDDDETAAEAIANDVLTRVRAGESFAALAEEFSKDGGTATNGGDLGALTEAQLPEALGEAVFDMQEGEVRGPVKGDFGFHVVRLDRILESGPLPFDQVRASLLTELQDQEAEGLFRELENRVRDALFDATDLAALAAASGLEVKTAAGFSRNGGEPLGDSDAVIEAVFDADVLSGGQLSDLVEVDIDRTVVVSVTNYNEATRRPLDEVREAIAEALRSSQTDELMAARAQQMQQAMESGEAFEDAATAVSAEVNAPMAMRRSNPEDDQNLSAAVFAAFKPEQDKPTVGNTRNADGGYTVFRIDAVMPGRPETIPLEERDAGKLQITDSRGVNEFVAFAQALLADADIVIDEDVLAAQDTFQ